MVLYSHSLLGFLEGQLQSAFNPYLKLSRHNASAQVAVRLAGATDIARLDDETSQSVLEISTARKPEIFYLGFEAPFEPAPDREYELSSLSITVFHKVVGELVPMFRAEWDKLDATGTSKHAQPHWHFVQSPQRIDRIVRVLLAPPGSDFDPNPKDDPFFGIADCEKFHFAMVSGWGEQDVPPLKRVFNEEDFKKWFKGLVHYIAAQILYLADKMPSQTGGFGSASKAPEGATM